MNTYFCFTYLLALTLSYVLSDTAFAAKESISNKPNYIILLADDISASSLGCYGSENPHTSPNIDKLAKESMRFTNMFVTEAVCGPARAELYTGLQPYRNGVMQNHKATKTGTLSVVHYLEKLGYRVGLTGKTHFSPKSVYPFEIVKGFPKNCNARETPGESWEGVEEFISRDPEQPFCLFICSIHAHSPWDAGDTSLWKLEDLKLPPHMADTPRTRELFREYLAEIRLFDTQVGKTQELLEKNNLNDSTALIVLDENGAGMPGGKWTNYDWGVRSACLIKWPGKPKPITTHAIAQYCDILPTLIEAAGGSPSENLDGKSLLPLLTGQTQKHRDKAFFTYNSGPEGPAFVSRGVTDGRFKMMWNMTPENLFAVRTINGFDFGYVDKMEDRHVRQMYQSWLEQDDAKSRAAVQRFRKQPEFQLYDLSKDPWEMNNLAENPEYTPQLEELKSAISTWMQQQGDNGQASKQRPKSHTSKKKQ
ncbi:sulfatase [Rubritalea spongiae]|uniref:Sulfatase n=1 Tax=Rubritalea spongiae TaxID=430797 RepID=A0ABW5E3F0_9BACT